MVFTHIQFRGGKRPVNTKNVRPKCCLITNLFEFISWNSGLKGLKRPALIRLRERAGLHKCSSRPLGSKTQYRGKAFRLFMLCLKFTPLTKHNRFEIIFDYMLIHSHNYNKIISFPLKGRILD